MSLVQPLTPAQSAKVRSYIFGLLRAQIPCAHRVVMGEVEWTPTPPAYGCVRRRIG
jgi:hypothetical protein